MAKQGILFELGTTGAVQWAVRLVFHLLYLFPFLQCLRVYRGRDCTAGIRRAEYTP